MDTKIKQIFLISNLTQFLAPKEPLSLSHLTKMRVQDLKTVGGLSFNTFLDLQQDTTTKMPEIHISRNGLLKLLKKLKAGKADVPDRLKSHLLRELWEEIATITKGIFDRSLQTGKLPVDWMKANDMPVLKKGDKSLASNYIPISFIDKHLDGQVLMYDLQHGFRD